MLRKRLLSALLCLCMVAGMLPAITPMAQASTNGHTRDEAVQWVKDRADEHWEINDGSGMTQCVEFVWAYYEYLLGYHVGGHAYHYLGDTYGACPNGWTRPDKGTTQPGDIVIWDQYAQFRADGSDYTFETGHIGIVVSVSGNTMVTAEANAGGERGSVIYKYNREVSCISGIIRPDWTPAHYADTQDIGDDFYAYIYNPMSNCNLENRNDNVQLASVNGSDFRQIWHFIKQDQGQYKIVNMFDGRCLDAENLGTTNGTNIHMCEDNGSEAQRWWFCADYNYGPYYVYPFYLTNHNLVLDVAGAGTTPGTNIQLIQNSFKETGSFHPAQTFQVNKIDNIGKISIGNDFYAYMNHPFSGLNVGNVDGNVELVTAEQYEPKQIWHFTWDSINSAYKITNEYDGFCLEAYDEANDSGNVRVNTDNGAITERWWACGFKGEDRYYFTPVYLGDHHLAMDVSWGNVAPVLPGTNIGFSKNWYLDHSIGAGGRLHDAQTFEIQHISYTKPNAPSTPTNIQATATSSGTTITWDAVPTAGAYDSRDYFIYLANTKNEIFIPTTIVDDNKYVSDVVLPDGEYFVTVRARNTKYYRLISDVGVYEFSVTPESVTHTITVNATEGGTASGGGTYSDGINVTVSATASEGYDFKGWSENGTIVSTNASYTFEAKSDRALTATFEKKQAPAPITHTVSASAAPAAGGTVTGNGTYQDGESVTVTATANTGYTFKHWTENGSEVSSDASYTFNIAVDRTLVAAFEKDPDEPDPPTPVTTYTVSVNASPAAGGTVSGGGTYQNGASATVRAVANSGYTFKGWTQSGTQVSTNASYTFSVTEDTLLTAVFEADIPTPTPTYRISVSATTGGTVSGGGSFQRGASATVSATPNDGYRFVCWRENGEAVSFNSSYTFSVSENTTLTAVFEANTPTPSTSHRVSVQASPTEGGTVTGDDTYQSGATVTIAATPNIGYQFKEWRLDGRQLSTTASYTFTASADQAFTAVFEKLPDEPDPPAPVSYTITISANPSAGGTVSSGGTFAENSAVTITATANSNYRFTGWFENGSQVSASASYTFTVSADRTLVAGFTYTGGSTITPGGNPSGNPSSGTTGNTSPSQPSLPVSTSGANSSMTTTASPNATIRGDTATSIITSAIVQEIIKQATANNSGEVVIAPVVRTDVVKTEITLPATVLSEIEQKTNAGLIVSTPHANVSFQNSGLSSLSNRQDVVVATERTGNALELSITVSGQPVERVPGGLTLTAPVDHSTPGTVAVVVHEDGSREVIRKSVADGDTITIPLDSPAKVEIIDNAKGFTDVSADSWAADAVAFASGHELFSGTGFDRFSPDLPMTRGMLAMVLHNLENNPAQPITGMFSDVTSDAWYSEAVAWAAARGIVSGYGNGLFGPNDHITREQLAVMLWRYAGEPAATNKELHFNDVDEVSGYALDALCWATENGVINGKGGGILDPRGQATRAQVAQMLMNYLKK